MIYIKDKYGIFVLIGIFLVLFCIFIFGEIKLKKMHYTEINRVINNNGGAVVHIQKVEEAPLQTSSRNNIYKIEYTKDGKKMIAYYRSLRSLKKLHGSKKKGYDETWLFL